MKTKGIYGSPGIITLYGLYLSIHPGLKAYVDQELHHRKFKGKYPEILEFMEEQVQRSLIFEAHGYLRKAMWKERRDRVELSKIVNPVTKQYRLDFRD